MGDVDLDDLAMEEMPDLVDEDEETTASGKAAHLVAASTSQPAPRSRSSVATPAGASALSDRLTGG